MNNRYLQKRAEIEGLVDPRINEMKRVYQFMLQLVEDLGGWPYRERDKEFAEVCVEINGHKVCAVTYKANQKVLGGEFMPGYSYNSRQAKAFEIDEGEWFLEERAFYPVGPGELESVDVLYGDVISRGFCEDREAVKEIFREIGWEG